MTEDASNSTGRKVVRSRLCFGPPRTVRPARRATAIKNFPRHHPRIPIVVMMALRTTDELRRRPSRSCEDRMTSCGSSELEKVAPPPPIEGKLASSDVIHAYSRFLGLQSSPVYVVFLVHTPTHLELPLAHPYRVPFLRRCGKRFHGCLPVAVIHRPVLPWHDPQLSITTPNMITTSPLVSRFLHGGR